MNVTFVACCCYDAMAGIYIHIPFCKQACHYCDFHFSTNLGHRQEMVAALASELALRKNYLRGESVSTIYLGGGTPSLLESQHLKLLLDTVRSEFQVVIGAEVTLEANPDDLSRERLDALMAVGINRLSIGVQSFHDHVLQFMNRAHNAAEAIQSIDEARKAGFKNISLDLIYAVPGQSTAQWKECLFKAIDLAPQHISAYSLTIEKNTVFGRQQSLGKLKPAEDEIAAQEFEVMVEILTAAGYDHYEISNFAHPGYHSRHNTSYWKQIPYLGIGPSAHSYDGDARQFNARNNALYVKGLHNGTIPFEKEVLSRENKINEYIVTTLRTTWGCDLQKLAKDFEFDLYNESKNYIDSLVARKLTTLEGGILRLTQEGRLLADKIAGDLFLVTDNQ